MEICIRIIKTYRTEIDQRIKLVRSLVDLLVHLLSRNAGGDGAAHVTDVPASRALPSLQPLAVHV